MITNYISSHSGDKNAIQIAQLEIAYHDLPNPNWHSQIYLSHFHFYACIPTFILAFPLLFLHFQSAMSEQVFSLYNMRNNTSGPTFSTYASLKAFQLALRVICSNTYLNSRYSIQSVLIVSSIFFTISQNLLPMPMWFQIGYVYKQQCNISQLCTHLSCIMIEEIQPSGAPLMFSTRISGKCVLE